MATAPNAIHLNLTDVLMRRKPEYKNDPRLETSLFGRRQAGWDVRWWVDLWGSRGVVG